MIRTQLYITIQEKKALAQIALCTGDSQSELIRKAIDLYCRFQLQDNRIHLLKSARGIWENRAQEDFTVLRKEMDRDFRD